ncbi:glycerophosphodiester phosphodiesterase [Maribacter sp. MJ134]|uniref:glycerophosphodiester phosphodiesterase n=1 Tax=Maribacter sp. MJ134 TaxID=2496865 RepID=UPI000F828856|nr:glycerophosphodiester phosphodiesterase family protein [Maribacter sp. MJ134]AZQ60217.1 glycerophosphodiester phosphodiesterase [Maribacter sp. MJ134]
MFKKISILAVFILITACDMKKPLVIGHRGAMGHETENSLASIQKALDLGVDMIEIDVFQISSGEIVVFHDEMVDRLTNGPGKIEEYNIYDLKRLTLDGGHKIPMLQDVLKLIDNKVALNIELKGANTSDRVNFIMDYYIKQKNWSPENFIISSFNWEELRTMRKLNDEVAIAVLTEENPIDAIPIAKELNAVAINPYFKNLDLEVVNEIRDAGFKIYTWTVNEPADIDAMKRISVDGIITNFPERVQ